MRRVAYAGVTALIVAGAAAGGYWAGLSGITLPQPWRARITLWLASTAQPAEAPQVSGPVIYYRHPDGEPAYAAEPATTADGRPFLPVHASEDLSFTVTEAPAQDPGREEEEAAGATGPRRVLYYRNPMGLPDTSPTPKKDSMGMDYIPVYEGEDTDGATVTVAGGRLQRTGVRTELAATRRIVTPIRLPGAVQLDERRVSVVTTRTEAFLTTVAAVTTGERVAEGQPLFELYSADVAAAGAQYLADLKTGGRAGAAGGARQRLENLGVPAEAIEAIAGTRSVPLAVTWRAPRDGIVLQRNATEGMMAAPGEVLFRLGDIGTVWIVADVPEHQLAAVTVGAAATIRVPSLPGRTFTGRVALIYPQVAAETRTVRVRIELANPDGVLLPDMYAEVEIDSAATPPEVAVPDSAVIDSGTRQIVIIAREDGRFEPRDVTVGTSGGGFTAIRSGVAAGDRVVVAANFLIDAESNLKAALSGLASGEASP